MMVITDLIWWMSTDVFWQNTFYWIITNTTNSQPLFIASTNIFLPVRMRTLFPACSHCSKSVNSSSAPCTKFTRERSTCLSANQFSTPAWLSIQLLPAWYVKSITVRVRGRLTVLFSSPCTVAWRVLKITVTSLTWASRALTPLFPRSSWQRKRRKVKRVKPRRPSWSSANCSTAWYLRWRRRLRLSSSTPTKIVLPLKSYVLWTLTKLATVLMFF